MPDDAPSSKAEEVKRKVAWFRFLHSPEPNRIVPPRRMYAFIVPGMILGYILGGAGGPVICCFAGIAGLFAGGYLYMRYRMGKLQRHFQANQ